MLRIAIVLSATVLADAALADMLSTQGRAKLFSSQTRVLDSRAAEQYNNSVRLQPNKVVTPTKLGPGAVRRRGSRLSRRLQGPIC